MTEKQKEKKKEYDREYSARYYAKHKDEILKRNSENKEKLREYQRKYRERTRLKALANIRFNVYKPGQYIVTVKEDGAYSFEMKEQQNEHC